MRCPTQPPSIQYLNWKKDTEAILKQHDHAFGNGQPPINTKPLTPHRSWSKQEKRS